MFSEKHTDGANGLEVGRDTLAENEGSWLVLGGVGDSVALSGNDTAGESVDGDAEGRRDKGSARNDNLEETHVDGLWGLLFCD